MENNLLKLVLESNLINFLVVFIFLVYALAKFLPKATKDRQDELNKAIENANKARLLAEQKLLELETDIKNSKLDAQSIIETAKASADNLKKQIIEDAKKEVDRMNANALKEIDLQKSLAIASIRNEIVSKAFELTEKNIENKKDEINNLIQSKVKEELSVIK
jgi:F-type H+-transporting ATPase subunit b